MKKFPAKLLLFGEYALMFGAKALAVPFSTFTGTLIKPDEQIVPDETRESAAELNRFALWLGQENRNEQLNFPLDLGRLQQDVQAKLYFRSDVPLQYGVGSSGALCAALFDEYSNYVADATKPLSVGAALLKQDFALLESYFHGRSSGLDPLVSFLNRAVLVEGKTITLPELKLDRLPWTMYLIDTKTTGATAPLVSLFLRKMEQPAFCQLFEQEYLPANHRAVDAFLSLDETNLFANLQSITQFQLDYFQEMIPANFVAPIRQLMEQNCYVKLLGSGGGGFLLAFVPSGVSVLLPENSLRIVWQTGL
ncbi:MAG: mevalonate kinase [Mangrovibacterium sp.]